MRRKTITILAHVTSWLTVLFLPYLFTFPIEEMIKRVGIMQIDRKGMQLSMLLNVLFLCGVFYINYHLLISRLLLRKKTILFISSNLVILFIFMRYEYNVVHLLAAAGYSGALFAMEMPTVPPFLLVVVISYGIRISSEWRRIELLNHALATEKAASELLYLKGQINPHFFFNTLNGIYALAIKKSDTAPKAILQLSQMMRYVLYDSELQKVPLGKEITYIKSYIDMQYLRLSENNKISYNVEIDENRVEILPLLFIPFIENAFKYGISSEDESEIAISLRLDKNIVSFFCQNQKRVLDTTEQKAGIGIINAKKRLKLAYPHHHILQIEETEETYCVNLTVQL